MANEEKKSRLKQIGESFRKSFNRSEDDAGDSKSYSEKYKEENAAAEKKKRDEEISGLGLSDIIKKRLKQLIGEDK